MVWYNTDRAFGSSSVEVFRMNGTTGKCSISGGPSIAKQAAYVQTYATATRTHTAATTHTITDSSGGTPSTSAIAVITQAGNAGSADIAPVQNAIATLAAELALVKADLLVAKKLINSLIDDAQALGNA